MSNLVGSLFSNVLKQDASGNVTVEGDLTVTGTTTTVSTTNSVLTDKIIELGNGVTGSASGDAGIVIERGSDTNVFIGWDESEDKFTVGTGSFTGATTGDLSLTDAALKTGAITSSGVVTATGFTIGSAVIAESELEQIDGITAGTVVASKAVVVDANKDVGTIRNLTIDGTFSDGNYTFDTSGNVSGLGTVGCGAITSSGDISTTGEIKTAKVSFTDGDDAITIADGGGITANTSLTLASGATVTAINDEDNMTSNSATALATQQSIKAYVDSQTSGSGNMDNWILEDDSRDEVTVSNGKEVKFIGSGITTNWTDTDNGTDADPYDLTFTVDAEQTGITSIVNSSLEIGRDADNRIKFGTDNQIIFEVDGGDNVIFKTGGEIEATSLDISGDITVGGGDATLGTAGNTTATTISTVTNTGTTVGKSLTISAGSTTTNGNNLNGGDLILASGGGDGTGTSSIQFKTKVSGTDAAAERMRIHTDGNVGIGTNAPGNMLHVAGADAYLLLQNTTDENGEGEAETRVLFGDHSGTGLAMIEASHSGTANDTKGKFIVFTHNGSSLTPAITVDDTQAAVFASTVTATGFTIGSAVISEAELEILDGANVTTAELNLLDGGASVGGSITIADSDGFIVNDGGAMKTIPASDLKTYAGGGGTAADDSNLILHMQVFA
jgi:hypothetical protein